jgi:hypothetical protein
MDDDVGWASTWVRALHDVWLDVRFEADTKVSGDAIAVLHIWAQLARDHGFAPSLGSSMRWPEQAGPVGPRLDGERLTVDARVAPLGLDATLFPPGVGNVAISAELSAELRERGRPRLVRCERNLVEERRPEQSAGYPRAWPSSIASRGSTSLCRRGMCC